jgi:hypothetical protein
MTAIAVNYRNPDVSFIADGLMPLVGVVSPRFKWTYFPPEQFFTVPDTLIGRKGIPQEMEFGGEERDASVNDYALDVTIPLTDITDAAAGRANGTSNIDPEALAVQGMAHAMQIDREKRVAAMVQDAANYDAANVVPLAGAGKFSDPASDPIGVITEALNSSFTGRFNVMATNRRTLSALATHPQIVKATNRNSGDAGIATRQAIADLFELNEILVGESFVNTARKGQTAAIQPVWGNNIALLHRDTQAGPDSPFPAWGWTAQFGTRVASRWQVRENGIEGAMRLRVGWRVREVVSAPSAGYLIQNAI